jgi:hypothetical protein
MLAEVSVWRWQIGFEMIAKDLLGGAWLAGNLSEAQKKWLGQSSAPDKIDANGLVFGSSLQNYGIQILDAAR